MGEATANVVARDILNHGLRFLHKSLIEMPDPLSAFLCVHKTDFECSIDASGYKADAQDFPTMGGDLFCNGWDIVL